MNMVEADCMFVKGFFCVSMVKSPFLSLKFSWVVPSLY